MTLEGLIIILIVGAIAGWLAGQIMRGTGFGLDIVRRRLSGAFGNRGALAVEPSPTEYRVSITWPIESTGPVEPRGSSVEPRGFSPGVEESKPV